MRIFIIPSWYPSELNPVYGTFNYEQVKMLAELRPNWNIGVSTWGQGDPRFLIYILKPATYLNLFRNPRSGTFFLYSNCVKYFSPAKTWTRKIFSGNIKKILKANELNLLQFIRQYGIPQVISAQATYPAAIVAQHLSIKYEIPYIVTIRMSPFPFKEFLNAKRELSPLIYNPLKKANGIIATSHSLQMCLTHFGLDAKIVNNPIDEDFFTISDHQSEELSVLTVGRLEEQKGYDMLLRAISRLGNQFNGILKIGGEGSQKHVYKKLAQRLGIEKKVRWLGQVSREEVKKEMQDCSFYILSSRHETFGNVLLEAAACGKPLVSTNCGGPSDIMTSKIGKMCEMNVESLATSIKWMINHFRDYDEQQIRESVVYRFGKTTWANRLEEVLKPLVDK